MAGGSFTTSYNSYSNVLKNEVIIGEHIDDNKTKMYHKKWTALWDTGATNSVITKDVVNALGLKPVMKTTAATPAGTYDAYCYYIDLYLPNHVVITGLLVMEGSPMGCDILVGMDVISKGDFAVTHSGKTVFSFRMPSCTTIDFNKHSYMMPIKADSVPGRNDPCPCGSGKKYKNCCGRS